MEIYSVSEIKKELKERYSLDDTYMETLGKAIQRYCEKIPVTVGGKSTNLWDKIGKRSPGKKNTSRCFTEEDKIRLLANWEFQQYLCNISGNEALKTHLAKRLEARKRAEELNRAEAEFWATADVDKLRQEETDNTVCLVSEEEFRQKKIEMMLEALFLKYFTPIDERKLMADMVCRSMGGSVDNTWETELARERLQDGRNYYSERMQTEAAVDASTENNNA